MKFKKIMAISVALAMLLTGCSGSSTNQAKKVEKKQADVVVIGAGAAGLSAALSAQQGGAKVILLEKAASVGGVSQFAGGVMGINSKAQKESGVAGTFSAKDVTKSWQDYNAWMSDGSLFYNIASRSGETIDWLQENGLPFTFMGTEQASHKDGYQTYHIFKDQTKKLSYFQGLAKNFQAKGGEILMETPATKLETKDDVMTGVVAKAKDGTEYSISTKSVVLATGGFGANKDVIKEKVGFPLETFTTGTQTGDGARMSQEIGAGVGKTIQQYHGVTSYSGIQTGTGKDEIAKAIYLSTSVWINQRGSRFCPEDLNYDTALSSNAAATQGEYYYSVLSEEMVSKLEKGGSKALGIEEVVKYEPTVPLFDVNKPWTEFRKALDEGVSKKTVFKGNTVEELAKAMNIDAETLAKTIKAYNADAKAGKDTVFGKDKKYMQSLGDGPFYAVKARPVSLGGIGGVLVNASQQVIKENGTVIRGLYAAGNEIAEQYNNSYPLVEGVSMMFALVGGRMAGQQAAKYVGNSK
ncbi:MULTISPECIES: FAD-dependent oxidoreductase [Terrabacteria group]|uniref:FAD-dependent oxidoreductase n=1 Tax=Bacillati TaxID=1783272 RepID=UPI001C6F0F78|nr:MULTISPECIES: FAD-dependent oxidoreductase [Terrabacteria group]MBW9212595.1 FAD-dependent oxidoreductase [Trueperella sp. zg.1013]